MAERLSKEFSLTEQETCREDEDEDEEWSVVYQYTADESDDSCAGVETVPPEHDEQVAETTPRRREDDFEQQIAPDVESPNSENDSAETFSDIDSMDSYEQLRADALVLMSEHLLATMDQGISPLAGADRVQLMVHIDANSMVNGETRTGEGDKTHCYLDGGPFLCPDTARRLACDAGIMTVLEDSDGNVLNVGRKSRTVPTRLRRALELRDQGCRFPGCLESRVDAHHIQHWCNGGETSLKNLMLLQTSPCHASRGKISCLCR